jgi:hypothetical protein
MYIFICSIFVGTLLAYTRYQEKSDAVAVYVSSVVHGLLHAAAVILLTRYFIRFNGQHFPPTGQWYDLWIWIGLLLGEVGIVGGVIGSFLFGLNLLVTCRWFNMNHNDAFSAMRLDSYRHILRMRIKGDEATLYAIGVDNAPSREEWVGNPHSTPGSAVPAFSPSKPLNPRLIEEPIVVRAAKSVGS